jgi:hypothetical protein
VTKTLNPVLFQVSWPSVGTCKSRGTCMCYFSQFM